MRKLIAVIAVFGSLLSPSIGSSQAGRALSVLGTDVALDGPAGADLTGLAVGKRGSDLQIQIRVANALPVQGSYPGAGIEWIFDVRGRTYIAEAHPEPGGSFLYTLFEVRGESLTQMARLEGHFDTAAGTIDMFVPLREIGARKKTRISGTGPKRTEDTQIHQHAGPVSPLLDSMITTKDFIVP